MNALRSHELLNRRTSRLLVVDIQGKLVALFPDEIQHKLIATSRFVCEGARIFGIPMVATEQYPKGLGSTVPQLTEFFETRLEKKRFSAVECLGWPPAAEAQDDRFQIVIIGMETHVCVLQTVLDLLALGYQTYVVVDALAARGSSDHSAAIERMANSGAVLVTAEGVLFEWCESADAAEFKQLSNLIKNRQL